MNTQDKIRNVAIIAHVDHGKTTIVDELLKQSGTFRSNQVVSERVMDSNDLEKERGITILAKNTAVTYEDYKINIIDTPGHADFSGEVERIFKMVDGVVLVVDAFEGVMPQTKFVLKSALSNHLPIIVCVNKIDRPEARIEEVIDEVLELFIELDADSSQLDCPFVYASAKNGYAVFEATDEQVDIKPLFSTIINHIPAPSGDTSEPFKMLVSSIDYDEYTGRIAIGRVSSGTLSTNNNITITNFNDESIKYNMRATKVYSFSGLKKIEVPEVSVGDIIAISGIPDINIGDTICDPQDLTPIESSKISPPTISMSFSVNDSPFAGLDGKFVTSRHLRDRLFKELKTDVSLKVEEVENSDSYKVSGNGELHLSILIETMRREGYEFQVSRPEVMYKYENEKRFEPIEEVTVNVPSEFSGTVIEKLGSRKGELVSMANNENNQSRLVFNIPARGLIGYRTEFLTDTKGTGILNTLHYGFEPYKGDIPTRNRGSLVAFEDGETTSYGLFNAQDRGDLFVGTGIKVYRGMCVGINSRTDDMDINVCKKKQLTNMRASGSDDALKVVTPLNFSLEQSVEFLSDDELLEVTPLTLRIRKKILDPTMRNRANRTK
ncbi:MAG: translational GTPase TypA [Lachnospirales bacterium]